jgi:hypothetical protein
MEQPQEVPAFPVSTSTACMTGGFFTPEEPKPQLPFTYAIVRSDLPLVHQGVQIGHALQRATMRLVKPGQQDGYLLYLEVANKQELLKVMEKLAVKGIPFEAYYEEDFDRGLTAIATGILEDQKLRKAFAQYSKWMSSKADETE